MAYPHRLHSQQQQQQQQQPHVYPTTRSASYNNPPGSYGYASGPTYRQHGGNSYGEPAQRPAMDINGHGVMMPPPLTQQQKQARQQPQQLKKPPYPHAQQDYFLPHASPTQQHATPMPMGPPLRSSTDIAERMGNMRLTESSLPYDDRIAEQLPLGSMPPYPEQFPMRGYGYGHGPAPASIKMDPSQQQYQHGQPSNHHPNHHPVPTSTPAPAPTPPPMIDGRLPRTVMVRRSVTAPLPPLDTDTRNPPDVPPIPSSTFSPNKAPAYPGQRVYSPVTKEHSQQQKYQAINPSRPPKIPLNVSSPTQSLNATLAESTGESGNAPVPFHPYHGDDVRGAAENGNRSLTDHQHQGFAPLDASQSSGIQEYYDIDPEEYVEYGGYETTATEVPPRTSSKAHDSMDRPSSATHPIASTPPVSSATPASQHTTSTTSSPPFDKRRHTPDFRPGSAPHTAPTSSNPTPPTTGYVAYKPYNPSEMSTGPGSSSTSSPTRPALPDFTGGTTATPGSPYASITPRKAYLPQEQPPVPTSPAAQMGGKAQPSPNSWQFAENDVRNDRSSSPRGSFPVETGIGYAPGPHMTPNVPVSGPPSVPPPPIRHMPTAPAPAGAFREGSSNDGRPAPMPHPPAPPVAPPGGRPIPRPGPAMFPPDHPQHIPAGGPPPKPMPYTGRSATMTSMTPPVFDRRAMTGTAGPMPLHPPGQGHTAPTPKPVPFRPGLGQPAPAPVRQYGPTPSHGPPQVQPGPGAPNLGRSATMTSMVSVPGSIPPASGPSGPAAQPSGVSAGSRSLQTAKTPPLTMDELRRWQNMAKANANDDRIQFDYAKKLFEASRTLVAVSAGNPKQKMKQKQTYVAEGLKILRKCAHRNYPDALFYLADGYGQGLWGLPKDPKEAFPLYVSAAKAGHGPSAYRTAVCCEMGPDAGTRRDLLKAVQWYRRAASLGDTPAMYKMGMIQLKGLLGQPRSPREAITWLKRAAERADEENPHALHELALLYENPGQANDIIVKDEKYALELLEKAGDLGYKYSQYRLGIIFEHGLLGFQPDPRQSILWYTRAAAQGEHNSELSLSGWYLTGAEGVLQQSDTEAYLWARKAAMAGLAKAEYAMGYFTEVGIGVPSNLEQAKRWYWKASSQNFMKARERLEDLKRGGAMMEKSKLSREPQHRNDSDCVLM